jgi:methyltransferase (TIGR00027 family)
MKKRIETRPSRTAEWTCICRAASSLETNACLKSGDTVALKILPQPIRSLIQNPVYRSFHCRYGVPKGIYPYIIARTKFMDAAYELAILEKYDRIVLLGAGFDSRAIRFPAVDGRTRVYEFDSIHTQRTKLAMYRRSYIPLPGYVEFEAIDFEKESLSNRLEASGFEKGRRCLFLMEGVSMYLEPTAVHAAFRSMAEYMGPNSRVAFDYVYSDVLRHEKQHYGETQILKSVSRVNEAWQFGIEKDAVGKFLSNYDLRLVDHLTARDMEDRYFRDDQGKTIGQVNDTHCLVTAERQPFAA